jgi:hypothetical protein
MNTGLFTKLEEDKNVFKNLYTWAAPERYWEKKDKAWYVGYSLVFVLIILVLAVLGEFIMILGVLAFMFLWFAQAYIPPRIVEHSITTIGIRAYEKLYKWSEINNFWFSRKNGVVLLHLEQPIENSKVTTRVTLIIDDENEDEQVFEILMRFIEYGRKDEVGYNILARIINGEYIEIEKYMK